MKRNTFLAGTFAATLTLCSAMSGQEEVPFARRYKPDEKVTYTETMNIPGVNATIAVDIDVTVLKVAENGRAGLQMHMSGKHETGTSQEAPIPADVLVQTTARNMPVKFEPVMGSIDFMDLFLLLASSTSDKKVKVGDEENWVWAGGQMSFAGTTKILSISMKDKQIKTQIKTKLMVQGQDAGNLTFTSTYDLSDGSLIQSDAAGEGPIKQTIKIVRKKA